MMQSNAAPIRIYYFWRRTSCHRRLGRKVTLAQACRSYATHHGSVTAPSSLLSQALDQKKKSSARQDSVGPFQLGLDPSAQTNGGNMKKWSELNAAGKVARTTARTSNLVVILVGAGLSAVLVYALTSELFSSNSSTVLYGQACEKLSSSPKLAEVLQKPYTFHNNPPLSGRPRHRNHNVSSQLVVDSSGREHMLLHFYIESRKSGSGPVANSTSSGFRVDAATRWTKSKVSALSEMTLDDVVNTTAARARQTVEGTKKLFKFLSGDSFPESEVSPAVKVEAPQKEETGWSSGITGLFAGLRSSSRAGSDGHADPPDGKTYPEGEVHADLVMNDQGYFEFRYLLVDIPNSHHRSPRRIFIERASGVRENEPVLQWHS